MKNILCILLISSQLMYGGNVCGGESRNSFDVFEFDLTEDKIQLSKLEDLQDLQAENNMWYFVLKSEDENSDVIMAFKKGDEIYFCTKCFNGINFTYTRHDSLDEAIETFEYVEKDEESADVSQSN